MSGGGGSSRTVQKTELDPVQRESLESVLRKSETRFQDPLRFFPGSTLAEENPLTGAGQNLALGQIPGLAGLAGAAQLAALRDLFIDVPGDPRTAALADAVTAPMIDRFQEQILPAIGTAANQVGAFGGSRQDIVKGIAARELNRAVGETRARVFGDAFRAGLDQRMRALSALPTVAQASLLPGQVAQDVGAQRQTREQQEIDAARERFEFEQFEPEARLDRFASRVAGLNLGGVTTGYTKQSGGGLFGK